MMAAGVIVVSGTASVRAAVPARAAVAPGGAMAVTELPGAASAVTAYAGWVVWSARDPAGGWHLTALHDGQVSRLPVAPRSTPFDADAGPDERGRPTLVYSRCTQDPTETNTAPLPDWATGRRCRLYAIVLGQSRERRLAGVPAPAASDSDYAPSIWHQQIAFSRLSSGTRTAKILLAGRGARVRRLAGGTPACVHTTACRPNQGHAGPLAMDLGPRVLAVSWLMQGSNVIGIGDGTELLAVPLDGRRNALAESGSVSGTCGYQTPNSPTATGISVAYLLNTGGDNCKDDAASFELFAPTGARHSAPAPPSPLPIAATSDGATTYWIADTKPHPDTYYAYTDCGAPGACTLMRTTPIPYEPSPRRTAHPPTF